MGLPGTPLSKRESEGSSPVTTIEGIAWTGLGEETDFGGETGFGEETDFSKTTGTTSCCFSFLAIITGRCITTGRSATTRVRSEGIRTGVFARSYSKRSRFNVCAFANLEFKY